MFINTKTRVLALVSIVMQQKLEVWIGKYVQGIPGSVTINKKLNIVYSFY